jgi:tetratricopeptide (TPR) repeat protein
VRTINADMRERVARAGRLADAALASAPDAPAAARVKIDALRLAGQQDAARGLVAKVIAQASQPETAYVLAALDLAEPEPLWTTVLERLRLAASGEGGAGRARAALVYSLAKSGDAAGARAELAKLDARTRPYPLSPDLHALVDKAPAKGALDAGEAPLARAPAVPVAAGGTPAPATAPSPAATPPGGGDAIPGDSRSAMQVASQAYKKGDLSRARQIYEAIVTRNPSDSEAVAALGDVARAQGDTASAIANYKRAIAVNPSYLPALLGLADTQWSSGDRTAATRGYGDIVDRFPEGTYPPYLKQRIDAASGAAAPPAAAAETSKPAAPAASDESSP